MIDPKPMNCDGMRAAEKLAILLSIDWNTVLVVHRENGETVLRLETFPMSVITNRESLLSKSGYKQRYSCYVMEVWE